MLLTVLLFVLPATLSPGGATTLATASGARFGVRRSLPLVLGIALGLASLAVASSLGLAGVVLRVPYLELGVRVAGSVYLLWLAVGIARSGPPRTAEVAQPRRFVAGLLLLWTNPKAWAMTLSAAGVFASTTGHPAGLALVLGTAFLLCSTSSLVLWCVLGGALARVLSRPWHWTALNLGLAVMVVASVLPLWLG